MKTFAAGDRVRCIDATPLPINVAEAELSDFRFPGGFLEEGAIYCVRRVGTNSQGRPSLRLCGLPVFCQGEEINWDSLRFRKLRAGRSLSRKAHKKTLSATAP